MKLTVETTQGEYEALVALRHGRAKRVMVPRETLAHLLNDHSRMLGLLDNRTVVHRAGDLLCAATAPAESSGRRLHAEQNQNRAAS